VPKNDVILYTSTNLATKSGVLDIKISSSPWFLLEQIKNNICMLKENTPCITKDLILNGFDHIHGGNSIITGQENAEKMAANQPVTFIWGPPGTGKTTVLGRIAKNCIEEGKRVLMLSYSNVAVDDATMKVFDICKDSIGVVPGDIIRYGYPRKEELLNHVFLTSYNMALYEHPSWVNEKDTLIKSMKGLSKTTKEYKEIKEHLKEIRLHVSEEEKAYVHKAKFVSTTVAKAVSDDTLKFNKFDTVLFDEASMAYIPQVVFASTFAMGHFVCLGDFCQLPPIVQNTDEGFLNTDIFQYCGIQPAVTKHWGHDWLCMLDEQYRMYPDIASFVSKNMYYGMLKTDNQIAGDNKRKDIIESIPLESVSLGIIDLQGLPMKCNKTAEHSHFNLFSGFIDYINALAATSQEGECSVGIITPYNIQAHLITAMIRGHR
jgi:hypothetical protein